MMRLPIHPHTVCQIPPGTHITFGPAIRKQSYKFSTSGREAVSVKVVAA